jgi:hypothetical protein
MEAMLLWWVIAPLAGAGLMFLAWMRDVVSPPPAPPVPIVMDSFYREALLELEEMFPDA